MNVHLRRVADGYVIDEYGVALLVALGAGSGLDAAAIQAALGFPPAGLSSPAFTGTPTAPTAAPGDDSTKLATTGFVAALVASLIDSSPGTLDTLNELAAALGDDPNFATTITTALATKLVKASNLSDLTDAAAALTNLGLTTDGAALVKAANYAAMKVLLDIAVKATGAQLRALTNDTAFLTAKAVADAMAPVALTDAATVALDLSSGQNFTLPIAGNRTLGAPTNAVAGQSGFIRITQDGTGSRTLAYASAYKKPGGTLTLSTAAGAVDLLSYVVIVGGVSPIVDINLVKALS